MRRIVAALCLISPLLPVCAAGPVEYRYLDTLSDPAQWAPAECELSVSAHTAWQHPALRMRIPVDFGAGEKQYPVGWPRMYLNLQPDDQTWQAYDRFEFQLYTESSRIRLPKRPLLFHLYNAQGQKKLIPLDLAEINASRTFTLNLSDIGIDGPVTRLGFNISEADYADKDLVDFHIGGFRLARATATTVTEFKASTPALFCDSRVLPFEVVVEGPPEKLKAGLPVQLSLCGNVVFTKSLPITRGRQALYLPLTGKRLAPGVYTLAVCPNDPALRKETTVIITSSP